MDGKPGIAFQSGNVTGEQLSMGSTNKSGCPLAVHELGHRCRVQRWVITS